MRTPSIIAFAVVLAAGAAGCGQKGPLVRPSRSPTSPVVIRTSTPADAAKQTPADDTPKR